MRYLFLAAGFAALAFPAGAQEEKASIYEILDNFVASSAAYNKCGGNDDALKFKFAANLMAVSTQAAMQAKEDHPYEPEWDLRNAMNARGNAIKAKVEEEIEKQGCASGPVKELIKLYEFNANWDMYGGSGR
jgi:hypothetical protein